MTNCNYCTLNNNCPGFADCIHKNKGDFGMTPIEHCRWCIRELPMTKAKNTIFYFLYGFHPNNATEYYKHIYRKTS